MVIFAITLVVLIGFTGLSIDVGNLLAERRGAQNAVDAAAMAAGRLILADETSGIEEQGKAYVQLNGYEEDAAQVNFDSGNKQVEVRIDEYDVPSFFLGPLYEGPWQVSARAVASVIHEVISVGILALGITENCNDPNANLTFGGTTDVNIDGSVLSNGCIKFNGNAMTGSIDGIVSAYSDVQDPPDNLDIDEELIERNAPSPYPDPFEDTAPPNCSSMDTYTASDVDEDMQHPTESNHVVLNPGRYTENINETYISLKSGVYCFEATLQASGFIKSFLDLNDDGEPQAGEYDRVRGDDVGGVMMYFHTNQGKLQMPSGHLAIKTVGAAWEDIVIWYANCHHTLSIEGNDDTWIEGTIYAPCSEVKLTGNSTSEVALGSVIAEKVTFTGTPTFNFKTSVTHEIEPPRVYLIE